MLSWYTESHMEPRYVPGERPSPASPLDRATEANPKTSKEKKTTSSSSSEFLAAAAIKDIKRPEGMPEVPKNESLYKAEKTWLGSDDTDTGAEAQPDDSSKQHEKDTIYNDIEHLTPGEARSVVSEYVEHRLPIIQQERTEAADSAEELAAIDANEAFLTHMRSEMAEEDAPETSPEDLIDQAMHDVIQELGLADTVAAREPETPDTTDTLAEDTDDGTLNAAQFAHISDEINTHGHGLPDQDMLPGAGLSGAGEPPHGGDGESFHVSGMPEEPQGPEPFHGGVPGPDTEPAREINPLPAAPNDRLERIKRDTERQQDMLKGMLMGGVIGYVIGRRRGRIKTEQKLKPIQEKLQREADTLRKTVAGHEQAIRSMAREKTASEAQARIRESRMTAVIRSQEHVKQSESVPKRAADKTPEETRTDAITDILAAPAKPLEQAPATHTEIARRNIAQQQARAAERSSGSALDVVAVPSTTKQLERVATPKTVESMPLPALIKASESVVVGGKTLKSYFESGRIGEHGMRRVLSEHLRTGKTEQALNVELFSHERRKKRSMEFLPAHAGGDDDEKLLPSGAMPPSGATSRHTPQSALVADDNGSRVVAPVDRKAKDGRSVSVMVVVISIILLAGVLFLALR